MNTDASLTKAPLVYSFIGCPPFLPDVQGTERITLQSHMWSDLSIKFL